MALGQGTYVASSFKLTKKDRCSWLLALYFKSITVATHQLNIPEMDHAAWSDLTGVTYMTMPNLKWRCALIVKNGSLHF